MKKKKSKKIVVFFGGTMDLIVPKQLHNNLMNSNDDKIVKQLARLALKKMDAKKVFDLIEMWEEEDI